MDNSYVGDLCDTFDFKNHTTEPKCYKNPENAIYIDFLFNKPSRYLSKAL